MVQRQKYPACKPLIRVRWVNCEKMNLNCTIVIRGHIFSIIDRDTGSCFIKGVS